MIFQDLTLYSFTEKSDLIECATINDLILGKGQVTPEYHRLIPVRGFFYRLVSPKQNMKPAIIVTLIIILIGYTNTALSQNSTLKPNGQFSVDVYKQISSGMTRAEVRNRLGDPAAIRANSLPKGPFWGPQEGIDINTLDNLRRYEEWQYEHKETVYLIWFGDPAREKSAWRTIGKTSYPKGAVF